MNSLNPEPIFGQKENERSHKHLLLLILSISIGCLYIHYNPARWMALWINFDAFFLVAKPYTWYSHFPDFMSITFLWLLGHAIGSLFLQFIIKQKECHTITKTIPIGWGFLAYGIFGLAIVQELNRLTIAASLVAISMICLPLAWKCGAFRMKFSSFPQKFRASSWDIRFAWGLLLIPVGYAFFCSLMPPTQSDGLRYHLSVPLLYLKQGGLYVIPDIAFSNFPFLIEYLYTIPLAFGLKSVPKLIHASFFLLTLRLIYEMGKRMKNERTGIFSALIFASVPFVSIFSSWSFIEMGLTFYTLLTLALCVDVIEADRSGEGNSIRAIVLCGWVGGFLLSCKYTALITIFLFCFVVAWPRTFQSLQTIKTSLGRAFLFVFVVGIVASPWFIKNLILLGNPVYPFANGLFPTPYWSEFNNLFFRFHAGLKGHFNELMLSPWWDWVVDAVTLPFRVTFFPGDKTWHIEDFGSWQLGPLWLTLSPLVLLYRHWTFRKITHAIAGLCLYGVWAYTYRDSRFLLPAMAVIAPLMAVVVDELFQRHSWTKWCLFSQIIYCLLFTSSVILLPTNNGPWWVISGTISEEVYLEEVCDFTRNTNQAFRWLHENTDSKEKVLLHGIEHPFYCPNDFVGADWFNTDPLIAWSWDHSSADRLLKKIQDEKIRYLVYYYGKIKTQYFFFYRLFRLPPEQGYDLLKEFCEKQYTRLRYPLAYGEWEYRYYAKMLALEKQAPNVQALDDLLDGKRLEEVFRYVYKPRSENQAHETPSGGEDGIVIYRIPQEQS